jgi:hypothetical protein
MTTNHSTKNKKKNKTKKRAQSAAAAQLEDFTRRANSAQIHTEESRTGEAWEVLYAETTKNVAQDGQDAEEWVTVGKTGAEKKK